MNTRAFDILNMCINSYAITAFYTQWHELSLTQLSSSLSFPFSLSLYLSLSFSLSLSLPLLYVSQNWSTKFVLSLFLLVCFSLRTRQWVPIAEPLLDNVPTTTTNNNNMLLEITANFSACFGFILHHRFRPTQSSWSQGDQNMYRIKYD